MSDTQPKAEGFDNRGDDDYPFGYVYFADGRRIPFALGKTWLSPQSGWPMPTMEHVRAAIAYLKDRGIDARIGGMEGHDKEAAET